MKLTRCAKVLSGLVLVGLCLPVISQSNSEAEIEKYRAQLQGGNPGELWEMKGEEFWKQKRGPKNASLEQCDLGKGPGVLKGAYAELPRYFSDVGKVMDLEARLVHCMQNLQGLDTSIYMNLGVDKVGSGAFAANGAPADMAAIATYVAFQSNGMRFAVDLSQPSVAAAKKTGEDLFWRRSGPFDFSCATCHSEPNKRIRLQALSDLRTKEGAEKAVTTWPTYRVSQGIVRTLQHRMWDCYWQMRHPDVEYTSDAVTALLTFLAASANGTEIKTPYIKR
jgi:L-cysteine S-thiosulfotransferase